MISSRVNISYNSKAYTNYKHNPTFFWLVFHSLFGMFFLITTVDDISYYRKIQKLGLTTKYQTILEFNLRARETAILAFLSQ